MSAFAVHLALYAAAAVVLSAAAVLCWLPSRSGWVTPLVAAGFAVETVSIAIRWGLTGHPPIFGTFENSIAVVWFLALAVLLLRNAGRWDVVGRLLLAWIPAFAVFGAFFQKAPYPLTISERSLWVDIHVLFAWASFTVLLAASMLALAVLTRLDGTKADELADTALYAAVCVGFVLFTAMIALGSWYSYLLFLDWFRWEIVESLAAGAWLAYASAIHAHRFFGWRGRRLAACVLATLPLLLLVFWVWSVYSGTYHHFDIPELRAR